MASKKRIETLLKESFPQVNVTWRGHWPRTEMVLERGGNTVILTAEFLLPITMEEIISGLWDLGVCSWDEIKKSGWSCRMPRDEYHEIKYHDKHPRISPKWNARGCKMDGVD